MVNRFLMRWRRKRVAADGTLRERPDRLLPAGHGNNSTYPARLWIAAPTMRHLLRTMDSLLMQPGEPAYRQTVLLVDEQAEILESLGQLLKSEQVEVLQASKGEQALEMLLLHDVALVVVEALLRGMDGYEITQWVR